MAQIKPAGSLTASRFEAALQFGPAACDLSHVRFIDAFGLVGSSVVLAGGGSSALPPRFVPPENQLTASHLAYMGMKTLLQDLRIKADLPSESEASAPDVVVPLQLVRDARVLEQLSHLLFAQLEHTADSQVLVSLVEALWELVSNALEHSGAVGITAAQLYRDGDPPDHDGTIQVVVGDAGRGIRESFRDSKEWSPATDVEAIKLAVRYLVSSVPDKGRGQGLTSTIEEVTGLTGRVIVRSGAGRLVADRTGTSTSEVVFVPGTIVGIIIPIYPG